MTAIPQIKDTFDLKKLADEALARLHALPPEQQAAHWQAQKKSWVIGELMLEHPEMTRERAADLYDRVSR